MHRLSSFFTPSLPNAGRRRVARRRLLTAFSLATAFSAASLTPWPEDSSAAQSLPLPAANRPGHALVAASPVSQPSTRGAHHRRPVVGRVTKAFDNPEQPWLPGHRGVDLDAPAGTPVHASAAGTIVFAGQVGGRPVVSIDHPGGIRTTYDPVVPSVRKGQAVARGQVIGTVAEQNEATHGPGLGWGAKMGENYIDPLSLLGPAEVRLKPVE